MAFPSSTPPSYVSEGGPSSWSVHPMPSPTRSKDITRCVARSLDPDYLVAPAGSVKSLLSPRPVP